MCDLGIQLEANFVVEPDRLIVLGNGKISRRTEWGSVLLVLKLKYPYPLFNNVYILDQKDSFPQCRFKILVFLKGIVLMIDLSISE